MTSNVISVQRTSKYWKRNRRFFDKIDSKYVWVIGYLGIFDGDIPTIESIYYKYKNKKRLLHISVVHGPAKNRFLPAPTLGERLCGSLLSICEITLKALKSL